VEAFRKADEVLFQAVKGISDLITREGVVNVDFADVRSVMSCMGRALMGTGCAKGEGRARLAAEQAIQSPLLDEISVDGATGVLINVVGGPDMRMREIEEAASLVQEQAHEDANIIFGASIDPDMGDAIKVTVIATGFQRPGLPEAQAPQVSVHLPAEAAGAVAAAPAPAAALPAPASAAVVEPEPVYEDEPAFDLDEEPEPPAKTRQEPLDFNLFGSEEAPAAPPAPAPSQRHAPAPLPGPEPIPERDDVFTLDDIDTPPILRRERKSY